MAVARDVASESHTGTTGSQSQASFSWSHAAAGSGVKGVVVYVFNLTSSADLTTSVTYGGTAMSAVTSGFAADTSGEQGSCKAYFLGASVPQGTQTVVVNRTNNVAVMYATAATVTAAGDTEYNGVVIEQEDQALAQENIDDGTPGSDSVRFAGTYSGAANITSALVPGANSTLIGAIDPAANCAMSVWETTAGQGARPVGFVASSDDVAAVYLAVREISSGTNHTQTVTDNEGLLDSIDLVAVYSPAQTDPVGLADSVSYVQTAANSFTDPLGLTDTADPVTTSVRDQTDNLGLTDSITVVLTVDRAFTDNLGMVDAGTWFTIGSDQLGLTDGIIVVASGATAHTATITDNLGLTDTATPVTVSVRSQTDNLGLTDTSSQVAAYATTVTDPLGLTDTATAAISVVVTLTDTLGLLDGATAELALAVTVTDPLGLTDTETAGVVYLTTITDLLGLTDSISVSMFGSTFWTPNPADYTANPAAYVPVGPSDTPPAW